MTTAPARYDDLQALFLNCTLTPSPGFSHTQAMRDRSIGLMRDVGVTVDVVRAVDHVVPPGVQPDMTAHGRKKSVARAYHASRALAPRLACDRSVRRVTPSRPPALTGGVGASWADGPGERRCRRQARYGKSTGGGRPSTR